jgi:hypothetical protein
MAHFAAVLCFSSSLKCLDVVAFGCKVLYVKWKFASGSVQVDVFNCKNVRKDVERKQISDSEKEGFIDEFGD